MERIINVLPWISLAAGGWAVLNGVLHDVFVLVQGKKYDRDLLRLLMDRHILITCGIMQMIAWIGLKEGASWSFYVSGFAAISLLIYCAMIFPFLKSFGMMAINAGVLVLLVIAFLRTV
jgi:hypothetical protein